MDPVTAAPPTSPYFLMARLKGQFWHPDAELPIRWLKIQTVFPALIALGHFFALRSSTVNLALGFLWTALTALTWRFESQRKPWVWYWLTIVTAIVPLFYFLGQSILRAHRNLAGATALTVFNYVAQISVPFALILLYMARRRPRYGLRAWAMVM